VTKHSKIGFFIITTALATIFSSCNKNKNDVIPDVRIDFTIDLRDFPNLNSIAGSDTVDAVDLRINSGREYAGGFNDNGIIIYRWDEYAFYAFDRTCPHDYSLNNSSIKVKIDGIFATCPKCGTIYALPNNGMPYSGPGKYYLKNYNADFDGRYLRVWN
jgi:hypothetical protein